MQMQAWQINAGKPNMHLGLWRVWQWGQLQGYISIFNFQYLDISIFKISDSFQTF
jgi:hypothetical protein